MGKVIIIAEAGVNHNGSVGIAKRLIDVASEAGVDFIKFQTFIVDLNLTKNTQKASYQAINTKDSLESMYDMCKKLELSFDDFKEVSEYANSKNIGFLSTATDIPSLEFIVNLNPCYLKIPSGDITNKPFLVRVAGYGRPIIMSTGMSTMEEVCAAVDVLLANGLDKNQLTLLQCNTEYPTPIDDVNLRAMIEIRDRVGVNVGYSDHTLGTDVPIAAVAMGATVIEKHFTLDKSMSGPDHKASLDPIELREMVNSIRRIERAMGDGQKKPSESEVKNRELARKSIIASCLIKKGEAFSAENLCVKRPGSGISPMDWDSYIGQASNKDYKADDLIE